MREPWPSKGSGRWTTAAWANRAPPPPGSRLLVLAPASAAAASGRHLLLLLLLVRLRYEERRLRDRVSRLLGSRRERCESVVRGPAGECSMSRPSIHLFHRVFLQAQFRNDLVEGWRGQQGGVGSYVVEVLVEACGDGAEEQIIRATSPISPNSLESICRRMQ